MLPGGVVVSWFALRHALEEAPGLAAAVAGAVRPDEHGPTFPAMPSAVSVLIAVARDDAVHARRTLDGDGTAPGVAIAGTVRTGRRHADLEILCRQDLLVRDPLARAADKYHHQDSLQQPTERG
ncbi:hypothetical protein L798_11844 [Zootermopsis nevadensis]|uniref:Uncharacterized protein n=1 Tax=Zootermopsis nevadensis TaxID=136037 RepID=A0A067QVM4_ZOONE|nr:hypothetical protein L798_11844 [Zootermopsis nevadensis]